MEYFLSVVNVVWLYYLRQKKRSSILLQRGGIHVLLLVHTCKVLCGIHCVTHCVTCVNLFPVLYVLALAVCKAVGTVWYIFLITND